MSLDENETLDVEKLLENCWIGPASATSSPISDQVTKKMRVDKWKRENLHDNARVTVSAERTFPGGCGLTFRSVNDWHAKEVSELEEGEIEEGEFIESTLLGTEKQNYGDGFGCSVNESLDKEEGEFVDSLLRNLEMPSDNGVEVGSVDGMEEGECVETDCFRQRGNLANWTENEPDSFQAEGALVDRGFVQQLGSSFLSETLQVAEFSIPIESPGSLRTIPSETKKSLDLLAQAEAPQLIKIFEEKPVVLSTSEALETRKLLDPSEMLEPRTSDLPNILDQTKLLNSTKNANEPDSRDFIHSFSQHEEKVLAGSVLPMLVEHDDPKTSHASFSFGAVQRSTHKIYPRRSKSACRTFPPGCGKNALHPTIEKSQNPVEYAEERRLGDVKTSVQNRIGQTEKSTESPFGLKAPSVYVKGDKEIRYSHRELLLKSGSASNKMSVKPKFPEKSVDKSHSKDEKYVLAKRSNERVNAQAPTVASTRPWNPGKQMCRSPLGLTMNSQKRLQKMQMHEMRVQSTSKSISRKRNHEDEVSSPGQDRKGDSPLVQRSRHRDVSLNMTGLHDLGDKVDDIQSGGARNQVRRALRLFQAVCRMLLRDEERKSVMKRVDLKAATILRENKIWVNSGKPILGIVPGVEVGDEFHYRVELSIIGLHRPYQGGIDFVNRGGKILATSIVASGAYDDDMDSSDVLVYSGQGGNPTGGAKVATDQKLERGNLALKNSMDEGTTVRVIRGFKDVKESVSLGARLNMAATLTYDGLYFVEKYWTQKGSYGNKVFMFQLRRMVGQPELAIKELKKSKKGSGREGICVKDISGGKEKIPIAAVNTIDTEKPPPFEYITKMIHPRCYNPTPHRGCHCKNGCSSSMNCPCAIKNGGKIPFNKNGAIVEFKPIVYECGPNCKCPSDCCNRVSQHGIMFQLEVFKTKSRGWGVRSLTSITSGSFICEYTGEFLDEKDAEKRTGNDEYLFDIGRNFNDHALWEGLSTLIPSDLKSNSSFESMEDVGFTIDAARYGNIGRFINHGCSPNLYAVNVLYDHDDKRMPHIMLFAAENIPPLKELTYHYNMGLDQVRDCNGNIKKKKCYCGSPECTGRMY